MLNLVSEAHWEKKYMIISKLCMRSRTLALLFSLFVTKHFHFLKNQKRQCFLQFSASEEGDINSEKDPTTRPALVPFGELKTKANLRKQREELRGCLLSSGSAQMPRGRTDPARSREPQAPHAGRRARRARRGEDGRGLGGRSQGRGAGGGPEAPRCGSRPPLAQRRPGPVRGG